MSRCPNTSRPHQFSGRAKYRFAGRTLQCVREAGHEGPCAWEPLPAAPLAAYSRIEYRCVKCKQSYMGDEKHECASPWDKIVKPQTPEQITASDARYREHLRRKARR